jgi:hypothetical protein
MSQHNHIVLRANEVATNRIVLRAAAPELHRPPATGGGHLGPFGLSWRAEATLGFASVALVDPNVIRIQNGTIDYDVDLSLIADLNNILPHICLPQVCIPTPFGDICSPEVCIDWPTVTIPVLFSPPGTVDFSVDCVLRTRRDGSDWVVDVTLDDPHIQLDAQSVLLLEQISVEAAFILSFVPFIGPLLAFAVGFIIDTVAVTGAVGLLGAIVKPFIKRFTFHVYRHSAVLQVLASDLPLDPAVNITLTDVAVRVDQRELELSADI